MNATSSNGLLTFATGLRDAVPIFLGYFAVGFAFALACVQNGHPFWSPVLMSATHVSGTGQFAVMHLLEKSCPIAAIVFAVFIFNLRYVLMALSIAQRLPPSIGFFPRTLLAMGDTDEIVAVAIKQTKPLNFRYYMGLTVCAYSGWVGGTLLGAWDQTSHLMSSSLQQALSLALYAMFIAIIVPPMRTSRPTLFCVLLSLILSLTLRLCHAPLTVGWITLLSGVASATCTAFLFPKRTEAPHA